MKLVTSQLATHLASAPTTLSTCWLVIRTDGYAFAATDHDQDIIFDDVTYLAASGGYNASDIATTSNLDVDNLEVMTVPGSNVESSSGGMILDSPGITEADLLAGLWDFADFEIFYVNWQDLTQGKLNLRSGKFGEVVCERGSFKVELRGMMQAYSRSIGRLDAPMCNADLGDSRCKVQLVPNDWQAGTTYATGDAVAALTSVVHYGRRFICLVGGTSGLTEPIWDPTLGAETTDGTVIWYAAGGFTVPGTITGVNADGLTLYDTGRDEAGPSGGVAITDITSANPAVVTTATAHGFVEGEIVTISDVVGPALLNVVTVVHEPTSTTFKLFADTSDTGVFPPYVSGGTVTPSGDSGFFDGGILEMTGGLNDGLRMEIKSYVPGQFTLQLPFPYAVEVGDTYTAVAGCDKSLETCRDRFDNIVNMRAFPYLPGMDKIVQVGRHGT